jgi:hypothetical protein
MSNKKFVPIKTEFLKWVIWYVIGMTTLVLLNALALMWYTKDLSSLGEISLGVVAWMTSLLGFYVWKAKCDHQMGYRHGYYVDGMSVEDVATFSNIKEENND